MPFVPKIIIGDKLDDERVACQPSRKLGRVEMIDINRLSQAFFRIQSVEMRERILGLIEEVAETEQRGIVEIY